MKGNHGGKREGAGRKSEYAEKTKRIWFTVPESHAPTIIKLVEKYLSKLKITTK